MKINQKRLVIAHRVILFITVALMIIQLILLTTKNPLADGIVLYSIIIALSLVLIMIAIKLKKKYSAIAYAFYAFSCLFCIAVYIISKFVHP